MKKIFLTLVLIFLVSACGGKVNTAVPISTEPPVSATEIAVKVTPVCISSDPTQDDVDRALAYSGELFNAPEWVRSYSVYEGRVSVSWSNIPLIAVAYVDLFIFPCSYEEPDLNNFFNDEYWQILFANYTSFEAVTACKTDQGLRYYEFKAVADGFEYNIKYWAQNDTDHRVIGAMIVFPVESQSVMDEYSDQLFPELVSCP